jgi:hypothetical protein
LNELGDLRATFLEQQLYLFHLSQLFQSLVKAAVDGTYNENFFGDAQSTSGYQKRIRAIIQNLDSDSAAEIAKRGHYREVTEVPPAPSIHKKSKKSRDLIQITRNEFIDHVQNLMKRTRGRESPGTFNPMIIVSDLFLEQSAP